MHRVMVIGAGPAGISAAIQLKRFGIDCIVIEKNKIGGLINNANLIENYLGFSEGIAGKEFVRKIKKQFERYDIPIKYERALRISYDKNFKVETDRNIYRSRYLVLALGTKPKKLGILKNNTDKIFYEVSEIKNIKRKKIAIVGAGDAAFDYAFNLCKNNEVNIFIRGGDIKAIRLLVDRVKKEDKIKLFYNYSLESVDSAGDKLALGFYGDKKETCDILIVAIGREPNDDIVTEKIKRNKDAYMIGDMKNGILRQTSKASGDGLEAAHKIYGKIKSGRFENNK